MHEQVDIVVVGARCAGAATAMLLARLGFRVLLLDKGNFPSDTLSTHMLKPRAMAYVRRWGLRDSLVHAGTPIHDSFVFQKDGVRLVGAPSQDALAHCLRQAHGFDDASPLVELACIRRFVLDEILVKEAVRAGAVLREKSQVEGVLREGNRIVGVRYREVGSDVLREVRARVVIGADGRHAKTRTWFGAEELARREQCTYTVYSYYADIPRALGHPGAYFSGRLGLGLGETNHGLTMISAFGPGEWFPEFRRDIEGNLLNTVDACFPALGQAMRSGRRIERITGTTDLANVLYRASGPGWMLVGDAGCHLDQCTAIGITHAFRDAQLAADTLAGSLSGDDSALDASLGSYAERRLSELQPQFEYVARVSECRVPDVRMMNFFAGLSAEPDALARFLGVSAAIVPRDAFFREEEIDALAERGRAHGGVPSEPAWIEQMKRFSENPWANQQAHHA
jgi:flavin-dependent dehydrogenase